MLRRRRYAIVSTMPLAVCILLLAFLDMCFAEIDLNYLKTVRQNQPVMKHRRSDLYAIQFNSKAAARE